MGIWIELGIFGIVIVFALWQLHDVRQAKLKRQREQQSKRAQKHGAAPEHMHEQERKPEQA